MKSERELTQEQRKAETNNMERVLNIQWICLGLVYTLFYGYIALGYDEDSQTCVATEESILPVTNLK